MRDSLFTKGINCTMYAAGTIIAIFFFAIIVPVALQCSLGWPQEGTRWQRFCVAAHPHRLLRQWQAIGGQLMMVAYLRLRYRWHRIYTSPSPSSLTIAKDLLYSSQGSKLDVYAAAPEAARKLQPPSPLRSPCAVFVHGGAWASGDKELYAAVGAELVSAGFVAVIPNYAKYPVAEMPTIEAELVDCMLWLVANGAEHGIDASKVTLIGHSAGAHICASVLLTMANAACKTHPKGDAGAAGARAAGAATSALLLPGRGLDDEVLLASLLPRISAFVGAAGVYDIALHFLHEASRGVEWVSPMWRVMQGKDNFASHSPGPRVRRMSLQEAADVDEVQPLAAAAAAAAAVPAHPARQTVAGALSHCALHVLHGSIDATVPVQASVGFCTELEAAGVAVTLHVVDGVDHMDLLLALMSEVNGGKLSNATVRADLRQLTASLANR